MMLDWKIGKYYFAVRCKSCDVEFAFLQEGQTDETIYFTDRGEIVLTCPDCHLPLAYSGGQITRLSVDPEKGMAGRTAQGVIDVLEGNHGGDPTKMPYVVNKEAFTSS